MPSGSCKCFPCFLSDPQPCPWKEFRTGDGKRYWSNIHTGISVWEEPRELKAYKAELARLQQQSADSPRDSRLAPAAAQPAATFTPHAISNSPFIATISTVSTVSTNEAASAPASSNPPSAASQPAAEPAAQPSPAGSPSAPPAVATWSTPSEAKAAFQSLLREVVTHPSMSWKEAVPLLTGDIRYTVASERCAER